MAGGLYGAEQLPCPGGQLQSLSGAIFWIIPVTQARLLLGSAQPTLYWRITVALNILAVTAEAFPLAKTGGLGDAVSGMAAAVAAGGPQVTLMLPAYRGVREQISDMREVAHLSDLPGGPATLLAGYCKFLELPVLLVQNDVLYDRDGLYLDADGIEYSDNAVRFAALAFAAARVAQGLPAGFRPHVVHAHDWHTALIPLYMDQLGVTGVKTMLTLHNAAFQGVYPMELATSLAIGDKYCNDDGLEFWGQLNFLKAGIRYADRVTVVSRNYAREILTPEFGCGLEGVFAAKGKQLMAIPNGIDTAFWSPESDRYLHGNVYSVDKLANKASCKRHLQKSYCLIPDGRTVLLAMGSRLTTQKMADVAAQALPMALEAHPNLQVALMGQGDKALERALRQLADRYPGRCGVHIGYDEAEAHSLHAGADVLLHGSRFEPFGLTPVYAMRYGTVPIGSRVGGMVDTIIDPGSDADIKDMYAATGLLFDGDQATDMAAAIARAVALKSLPVVWRAIQRNGMRSDFSWAKAAPAYISAYRGLRPDIPTNQIPERRAVQGDGTLLSASAIRRRANHVPLASGRPTASRPLKGGAVVPQGASLA